MLRFRLVGVTVAASAALAAAVWVAPVASASGAHIGPRQYFTATVNGMTGETTPAVIKMVCAGPSTTGHPLEGQTVAVHEIFPPSGATTTLGYTGTRATSIGVFFGPPPPAITSATTYINITRYGSKAIPTTLTLPCSGTGHATFVPLPLDPSAHDVVVPVTFANIAV